MVDCPICARSFATENAVAMHVNNKSDEKHGSFSKGDAYDMLRGSVNPDTGNVNHNTDNSTDSLTTQSDANDGTSESGGNRLDLSKLTGSDDEDDEPEPSGCPNCGNEDHFPATQLLAHENSSQLSEEEIDALRAHDRVCTDCGECYDG